MMNRNFYVALDIETTGLDPARHGICQIGAVMFDDEGETVDAFRQDCNPGEVVVDQRALEVNGFTLDRIRQAKPVRVVVSEFAYFAFTCKSSPVIVCHNAPFDVGFMLAVMRKHNMDTMLFRRVLDTISLAFAVLGDNRCHSLKSLSEVLELSEFEHHDAYADATRVREIFKALRDLQKPRERRQLA